MGQFSYGLEAQEPDGFRVIWDNPTAAEDSFNLAGQSAIAEFQITQKAQHLLDQSSDAIIFPFIQAGAFGIREEKEFWLRYFGS